MVSACLLSFSGSGLLSSASASAVAGVQIAPRPRGRPAEPLRPGAAAAGRGMDWQKDAGRSQKESSQKAQKESFIKEVQAEEERGAAEELVSAPGGLGATDWGTSMEDTSDVVTAAASAKASFLHLSGAEIYSPMVGEAEASVREFFARGRAVAPAVLLLDELDAIVGKRDGGGDGGDAVQQRVLSTLLNEVCRLLTNPFAPYVTPHFPLHVYITHPFFLTRWTA